MGTYFDDLIRVGRYTDAMRLFAKEYYDNRMMGHTRKLLCERVADENDKLQAELALLRKVADAARALIPSEMYQYTRHLFDLKHTLDEYQTWKEGQK